MAAEKWLGWINARFINFITHRLLFYLLISHKILSWILLWNEYHQCQNTSITAISSLVSVSPELDLFAHVSHGYLFCFSTNHNHSYLTRDHTITSPTSSPTFKTSAIKINIKHLSISLAFSTSPYSYGVISDALSWIRIVIVGIYVS